MWLEKGYIWCGPLDLAAKPTGDTAQMIYGWNEMIGNKWTDYSDQAMRGGLLDLWKDQRRSKPEEWT